MLGLVATPSPTVFAAVPVLISIPFAIWRQRLGGVVFAAIPAALAATCLSLAFLLARVGYSPTGISIAAALLLMEYVPLCLLAVAAVSWLQCKLRAGS